MTAFTATSEPRFLTVGTIADELGVPVHRVQYVLSTRQIAASGRAGAARVFDREALTIIRHEIRKIDAGRAARRRRRGTDDDE